MFQRLINEIPPHDVYIAGCAGHDAVAREKRPAALNILIDRDPEPLNWWSQYLATRPVTKASEWKLICHDVTSWLRVYFDLDLVPIRHRPAVADDLTAARTFLYLDPPYLMNTRSSGEIYTHEMSEQQHIDLLETIRKIPCNVMISGYCSVLYSKMLKGWRTFTYQATVRSGATRTEWCWCNFPTPMELHDSRFVGNDKRARENIRRRTRRLIANLAALPHVERQAVLDGLDVATKSGEEYTGKYTG